MDLHSKVVGVTRHNHDGSDRQEIAKACRAGEALVLRHEPDNAQDANAVAVFRENGDQIGYLSASVAEQLAPLLDADAPVTAVVEEVTGGTTNHPYGVNVRIYDDAGAPAAAGDSAHAKGATAAVAESSTETTVAKKPFKPILGPTVPARRGCVLAIAVLLGILMTGSAVVAIGAAAVAR